MVPASGEPPATPPPTGLTEAEARARLARYGPNEIPDPPARRLRALLGKFWGPIPWMLEVTIGLQLVLGKSLEAAVIALLLGFNALVGFIEEGRASKALDLLRHRLTTTARVLRDGTWRKLPAAELVPGDVVHLRMGDLAPADVQIGEGEISIDQSALTGESAAVEAGAGAMAYAAAIVRRGEATGTVTATGRQSYFGKTAELVRTAHAASHLATTIFRIVRALIAIDVVLVGALLAYAAWAGLPLRDVLPFSLILLVASVPVALPATFTLATALGAAELARSGVLLTRLAAIEEAAGMDVLCTDKTGTLTENRMTLTALQPIAPSTEPDLLRLAALASDTATQDPIDLAVLRAAAARNLTPDPPKRLAFQAFDPATRYSLAKYGTPTGELWAVKGAPREVAALTATPPDLTGLIAPLAATGARVLAVASGENRATLRLAGLIALQDPPRPDAADLVKGLQSLGIRVVMVSGDAGDTAASIARRVGILGPVAPEAALTTADPAHGLDFAVYARVFPEQKIKLIRLLQAAGHIVGMTGDGVNDAPALKQADIGIAVASATDVARAAAAVALTTPGLVDILTAVRISRRIYQRMLTYTINKIMKTLEIAVFLTVGVIVTGQFIITPLLIVLLLFTNDFVTMSLATDNVGYSPKPDRWRVGNLMLTGSVLASLVLLLSFSVFFAGRDWLHLPLGQLRTLIFVMLVATGQGNVYLVRERGPFWRSRPSRWLILSSVLDILVVSLMAITGWLLVPVSPRAVATLLAVVALYLLALDQIKLRIFRYMGIQ